MEELIIFWLTSTTFLAFIISPLIVIGCGGKKPAAAPAPGPDGAVGPDGKPAVPTKACNTKSGLLNDDPDLKSDLLMAKPAGGGAAAAGGNSTGGAAAAGNSAGGAAPAGNSVGGGGESPVAPST